MNGRVDLDAWGAALQPSPNEAPGPALRAVLDMIAELRAARTVVETLRIYDDGPMELPAPLAAVLAAYDEAVAS